MSNHEIETSANVFVTSEKVARQIKAVTHPLSEQLTHPCELIRELRNEQVIRRHDETASRAPSPSSGSSGPSDSRKYKYTVQNYYHIWEQLCKISPH